MYSKVKIAGRPLYPMLLAYLIVIYITTLVCYIVYNYNEDVIWFKTAYIANISGVIMAAITALPGFIDWLNIPAESRAKKTGFFLLFCNVFALILFELCFLLQENKWNEPLPGTSLAIPLTAGGFILTSIAGFLGWKSLQKQLVEIEALTEVEKQPALTE